MQCLGGKKKKSPTFGKTNLLISVRVYEFAFQWYERSTAFTLNQTNITSHSDVFALRQETHLIVSRAAVLMNGEEASGSQARHAEKAARRNGQRCHSSTYLHRKAILKVAELCKQLIVITSSQKRYDCQNDF